MQKRKITGRLSDSTLKSEIEVTTDVGVDPGVDSNLGSVTGMRQGVGPGMQRGTVTGTVLEHGTGTGLERGTGTGLEHRTGTGLDMDSDMTISPLTSGGSSGMQVITCYVEHPGLRQAFRSTRERGSPCWPVQDAHHITSDKPSVLLLCLHALTTSIEPSVELLSPAFPAGALPHVTSSSPKEFMVLLLQLALVELQQSSKNSLESLKHWLSSAISTSAMRRAGPLSRRLIILTQMSSSGLGTKV